MPDVENERRGDTWSDLRLKIYSFTKGIESRNGNLTDVRNHNVWRLSDGGTTIPWIVVFEIFQRCLKISFLWLRDLRSSPDITNTTSEWRLSTVEKCNCQKGSLVHFLQIVEVSSEQLPETILSGNFHSLFSSDTILRCLAFSLSVEKSVSTSSDFQTIELCPDGARKSPDGRRLLFKWKEQLQAKKTATSSHLLGFLSCWEHINVHSYERYWTCCFLFQSGKVHRMKERACLYAMVHQTW